MTMETVVCKQRKQFMACYKLASVIKTYSDGMMRSGGRPKLIWRYMVRENMARNQMPTEMAANRKHWHVMIQAGTLLIVEAER